MKKDLNKEQLEELVNFLKWNHEFGCYTRQAFEHIVWPEIVDKGAWIIFFDIDDMKGLNDRGSWDETSALVKRSIGMRSSDHVAGQVFSGDEFVVVISKNSKREPSDPSGLCRRLQDNFRANGASATFAFGRITSTSLHENLKTVKELVKAAKKENRRGTINAAEVAQ